MFDIRNRVCCVVGGGSVAQRKAISLCSAGGRVKLVSPKVTACLSRLSREKRIQWVKSSYAARYLKGAVLVIAATNDTAVNRRVSADSRAMRIPVNVVDVPGESTFIVPSVIDRSGLIISISTSGKAPCLAKKIRQDLERSAVPRYARLLKKVSVIREKAKRSGCSFASRKALLTKLVSARS